LEEAVEGGSEEEGEEDVWKKDTGEEEDTGGGEDSESSVEGGTFAEGLAGPVHAEQHEEQDAERLGKMHGEGVATEDTEAGGDDPVGERGLFHVTNVVDAQGDPVAGKGHLAGGVGVGSVGVVQHGRSEERGEEEDEPERSQKSEHADMPGVGSGTRGGCGIGGGDGCHEKYLLKQHTWWNVVGGVL
jgi:hypothetical protein